MHLRERTRAAVGQPSRRWAAGVVASAVLAYGVLFALNVAMIVFVAWLEPLHGFSTLERSELHQLAGFGGVRATYDGVGPAIGGVETSVTRYYHVGNEDLYLWIALSGLAYSAVSFASASVFADDGGGRGHVTTALAMAVPFAAIAGWRALAFGTRVSHGNEFTVEPARTVAGALLFALVFGALGGALARWRRG